MVINFLKQRRRYFNVQIHVISFIHLSWTPLSVLELPSF